MNAFKWNETMSVKVEKFDQQHQKLIQHINDLFTAMSEGRGRDQLSNTLDSLSQYTRTHFKDEESMMSRHEFPGLVNHRIEHETFITKVEEYQDRARQGGLFITTDIMEFLRKWLTDHIMGTDKRYSDYLNKRGVK